MSKFVLLKQSFPVSRKERKCDAYDFILEETTAKQRKEANVSDSDLATKIDAKERYLYRVGKEDGKFKALHISLKNFEIIRSKLSHLMD